LSGFTLAPRRTFLVHGEPKAIEGMKDHILSTYKAWQVDIPAYRQSYEI
jgi:metallo-beta-lactamase family protein